MLDVDFLYKRVVQLSGKGQNGYHSNDEFNDNLNHAQQVIYNYLLESDGSNKSVSSFLYPFIKVAEITNPFVLPSDYREDIEVNFIKLDDCGNRSIPFCAKPLRSDQVDLILKSPIRKPSSSNFMYEVIGGKLIVRPLEKGVVSLKYYSNPPVAKRSTTVDINTDGEVYDESNSVQLVWPEKSIDDFVDILLHMKGIILRESPLIRYVESKNILSLKKRQNE